MRLQEAYELSSHVEELEGSIAESHCAQQPNPKSEMSKHYYLNMCMVIYYYCMCIEQTGVRISYIVTQIVSTSSSIVSCKLFLCT